MGLVISFFKIVLCCSFSPFFPSRFILAELSKPSSMVFYFRNCAFAVSSLGRDVFGKLFMESLLLLERGFFLLYNCCCWTLLSRFVIERCDGGDEGEKSTKYFQFM